MATTSTREKGVKRKQEEMEPTPAAPSDAEDVSKKARLTTVPVTSSAPAPSAYRTHPDFYAAMLHTRSEQLKLPENKVFVAQRTDRVIDVFKGLLEHNFTSVPVLTKSGKKYWGFLDMVDIVNFIVPLFDAATLRASENFWKEFEVHKELRLKTVNDICVWPMTRANPFHPVRQGFSLLYAMEALGRIPHLRRLAVVDDERRLVNLITQSQMVELLQKNMNLLGEKVKKPVSEMRHCFKTVHSIRDTEEAFEAFKMMSEKNLSAVAVLGEGGKLVETITLKDLKGIGKDGTLFYRLYKPAKEYTATLKKDWEVVRPRLLQVCVGSDTLRKVITQLIDHKIHRVWIVDDDRKPIGVISLRDVLYDILTD